jgi:hypothetical protein
MMIDIEDHKGSEYRKLIGSASTMGPFFQLVVRDELPLEARGNALLRDLTPFLEEVRVVAQWPGTILLKGKARQLRYRLNNESTGVLGSANSLADWCQPELPSDLTFLRSDGTPWLVSIAHESDFYLEIDAGELATLRLQMPFLRLKVRQ